MANTHVACIYSEHDGTEHRIAGGTEDHCRAILDQHIAHGDASGYIRPLTDDELR